MISLIIPVCKNEESLPALLDELTKLNTEFEGDFEVVFVVDGSPDNSYLILAERLPTSPFSSQLISLSRNFGSFAAIRAGLDAAKGDYFAIMAADLQEPPGIILDFHRELSKGNADVVVGQRTERADPLIAKIMSGVFWRLYRRLVNRDVPHGGVDIFGGTKQVRDRLLELHESHSSLIGLLFWVGFRRSYVPYVRRPRLHGKSAWTFRRKLNYLLDSFMSFTDLPIRLLLYGGVLGVVFSVVFGVIVLAARAAGAIDVPGYTPIVLALAFFGGINCLGLGVIGGYVWRSYENTKSRPLFIKHIHLSFDKSEGT
ncbi:MAG: glycosyltransferase family 2 protein [Deltaproteobacteria bacterium]|nr:glycosyltransferase family 2 protein [Deltaproteobacteria bacterium]